MAKKPETLGDDVEVLGVVYLRGNYVDVNFLRGLAVVWDNVEVVCC